MSIKLDGENRAKIDAVIPPGSAVSDYYDVNVYRRLRGEAGVERK